MIVMKWILFSLLCLTIFWQIIKIAGSYDKQEKYGIALSMVTYIALAWYIFIN